METANPDFFRNLSLLGRPRLLLPNLQIRSLSDLPRALKPLRIKGLILDVDQTIAPYGLTEVPDHIAEALNQLRDDYRCCYVSNVPNTEFARFRLRAIEVSTSVKAIATTGKKPAPLPYQAALAYLGTSADQTAMVGDRVLTDILGANNAGLYSVLVKPLDWSTDPFLIKAVRLFESLILSALGTILR